MDTHCISVSIYLSLEVGEVTICWSDGSIMDGGEDRDGELCC